MRAFPSLSFAIPLAACVAVCSPTNLPETSPADPCTFTFNPAITERSILEAETNRLRDQVTACDQLTKTRTEEALRGILENNCPADDTKIYIARRTELADNPGFLPNLEGRTDISYAQDPKKAYSWNANLFQCDDNGRVTACNALLSEFAHGALTQVSSVSLLCTKDQARIQRELGRGVARRELDLSGVRVGYDPNAVVKIMLEKIEASTPSGN